WPGAAGTLSTVSWRGVADFLLLATSFLPVAGGLAAFRARLVVLPEGAEPCARFLEAAMGTSLVTDDLQPLRKLVVKPVKLNTFTWTPDARQVKPVKSTIRLLRKFVRRENARHRA